MNIIEPSYQILVQSEGLDGVFEMIEWAGRTCYKSEKNISDGSAKKFVERMVANKHYAMLEHGTVYLNINYIPNSPSEKMAMGVWDKYSREPHSRVRQYNKNSAYKESSTGEWGVCVTTNYRVIIENGWEDDLKWMCQRTEFHERRVTVLFHTQIAISREFNRHRSNSMAESSTRYCNYSKDKFGSELTINKPVWVSEEEFDNGNEELFYNRSKKGWLNMCHDVWNGEHNNFSKLDLWWFANMAAEFSYMKLLEKGCTPQEARAILPLDTSTDLVHTAFISDWMHFFDLRALDKTGKAHPDAKILAKEMYDEFVMLKYIR